MLQAARFSILILLLSLIGCYPAYNWRLVQTDEFGWEALFPAKPNRSTRKINILNRSREMVITIDRYSVLVDDMNFVLDVMNYEGEVSASPGSLQGFINDALKNNFNMRSFDKKDSLLKIRETSLKKNLKKRKKFKNKIKKKYDSSIR